MSHCINLISLTTEWEKPTMMLDNNLRLHLSFFPKLQLIYKIWQICLICLIFLPIIAKLKKRQNVWLPILVYVSYYKDNMDNRIPNLNASIRAHSTSMSQQ